MGKQNGDLQKRERRSPRYVQWIESLLKSQPDHWGRRNEERLYRLLTSCIEAGTHCPPWMYKVVYANQSEDRQGIDLIVTSDVGPLFLQVKTSEIYKRKFEHEQQRRRQVGKRTPIVRVVLVSDDLSDARVLKNALRALHELHIEVQLHGSFYPSCHKTSA